LLFALVDTVQAADAVLEQARQFIEKNDAKAAYELLIPLQSERAGDPVYDLLLGSAANNIGKYSEAVFALERALAMQPDNAQARAEIARAYFYLGERPTAKSEFESVSKQDLPPAVLATIRKYLDAITRVESAERTTIAGYAEMTVGWDSNVNAATGGSQVAVPAFGGAILTLNRAGTSLSDNFGSVGGGVSVRHALTPKLALLGGIDVKKRVNSRQDDFNTGFNAENVGFNYTQDKNSYTFAYQKQDYYVDYNLYRQARGVIGQYQHAFTEASVLTAYAQYTPIEYPAQDIRNANRAVGGLAYARAFGGEYQPVVFLGGYGGSEAEKALNVPHLGHEFWGLRAGGRFSLRDNLALFANASREERRYGGADPLFLTSRHDAQNDLALGLVYTPAKFWSITPQITYTRNDSNIQINQFERTQIFVTVRREFK
jgi:tetratricopeptide (TPR) repeat protein